MTDFPATDIDATERGVKPRNITAFCRIVRGRDRLLSSFSTENLAEAYRRFFNLPNVFNDQSIKRHCRQIKTEFRRLKLPDAMSAYNQEFKGRTALYVNDNQWPGIWAIAVFHEVYEIIERRFAAIYKDHKPLTGAALESRANKFASCIVVPSDTDIDLPRIIALMPCLILHLGKGVFESLYTRIKSVIGDEYPFVFVRYKADSPHLYDSTISAVRVEVYRPKALLPARARRILRSFLPRVGDGFNRSEISNLAYAYQGPVVVVRDNGFDILKHQVLSFVCLPVFKGGELSELIEFGFKLELYPLVRSAFASLKPKVIEDGYQVV